MAKLTQDEVEALEMLLENDEGCKALYTAIQSRITSFEDDLLSHPYIPGNENVLGYKKARLDGAQKLLTDIKLLLRVK